MKSKHNTCKSACAVMSLVILVGIGGCYKRQCFDYQPCTIDQLHADQLHGIFPDSYTIKLGLKQDVDQCNHLAYILTHDVYYSNSRFSNPLSSHILWINPTLKGDPEKAFEECMMKKGYTLDELKQEQKRRHAEILLQIDEIRRKFNPDR